MSSLDQGQAKGDINVPGYIRTATTGARGSSYSAPGVTGPWRRDELGIRFGTQLAFTIEGGRLIGAKVDTYDPVAQITGIADAPLDATAYLNETRGLAE